METPAQLSALALTGCGSVQGFLLSEAVPASDVPALLQRLTGRPLELAGPVEDSTAAVADPDLYRLVYHSQERIVGLDGEVLQTVDEILATSRRNNAAAGITGALMFTDGFFAQVLEGERVQVERVFERIQLDDRHADVHLLAFDPAPARIFKAWAMAFVGSEVGAQARFGHYAGDSGFDFQAVDADSMCRKLRELLEDEERRLLAA